MKHKYVVLYMKYILKNLKLPIEIINIIYSYLDYIASINFLNKIWYKRLISPDFILIIKKILI